MDKECGKRRSLG